MLRTHPSSRYLFNADVVLGLDVMDKKRALEELSQVIEQAHHVRHAPLFRALWRREQAASTAVGHGVAIPHARMPDIAAPILLFARTKRPIAFDAPDRRPVSMLFVLVVPEEASDEHLRLLATIAELMSNRGFRKRLEKAEDAIAIRQLLA
jgi:PTS system nitrogen regulatory IIA component